MHIRKISAQPLCATVQMANISPGIGFASEKQLVNNPRRIHRLVKMMSPLLPAEISFARACHFASVSGPIMSGQIADTIFFGNSGGIRN